MSGERASTWEEQVETAESDLTMNDMDLVVERGRARCPHCVAVSEYTFVERDRTLLRYEVHCADCGVYRERLGPVPAKPGVLATNEDWSPVAQPVVVPLRQRVQDWAGVARTRSATWSAAAVAAWNRRRPMAGPVPALPLAAALNPESR